MVASLMAPLYGSLLQQRRSCFEERLGQPVAAAALTLHDDPLRPRGLGSRTYDGEGLAARRLPLITAGRLDNYLIDVYYGRKLGLPPTTGGPSNVVLQPGDRSPEQLLAGVDRGILVTGFLGGNANPATGDFSFGITGQRVQGGRLDRPVSEMNVTGNHLRLWQRLAAAGDDPYPHSAWRIPSLVIEDVQFSGI
jgi:PmbA protein